MEISGKVIDIKNGFGFILPDIELPDQYTRQQVFFNFKNVEGNVNVSLNDQVIFEINDRCNPDKPSARKVTIPHPIAGISEAEATSIDINNEVVINNVKGVKFPGVIVTVKTGFGFIQPDFSLPAPYTDRQFYFQFRHIINNVPGTPSQNDKVSFEINERSKPQKPSALNVLLVDYPEETSSASSEPQIIEITEEMLKNIRDTELSGIVLSISENFGFIKPDGELPAPYTRGNVHFSTRSIINKEKLSENDKVIFTLNEKSEPQRPSARVVMTELEASQRSMRDSERKTNRRDSLSNERNGRINQGRNNYGDRSNTGQDRDVKDKGKRNQGNRNNRNTNNKDDDTSNEGNDNGQKKNNDQKKELGKSRKSHNSKDMFSGKIVKLLQKTSTKKGIGYIKPSENLPPPYPPNKDVFFYLDSVQSGQLELKLGDEVEFSLGTKDPQNPKGFRIKVTKFATRSENNFESYIQMWLDKVNDGVRSEDLLGLTSCDAVWITIGNVEKWSVKNIISLMSLVETIEKSCRGLEENFKHMLEILTATSLFNPFKGGFRKYVENTMTDFDLLEDISKIGSFLSLIIQYVPQKTRAIVGIIKPIVSKNPNESFLYEILKLLCKSSKHICVEDMEWDELPLVPSVNEILHDSARTNTSMKPVKKCGRYSSPEEYIDTYFRLLRADCFDALTTGIKALLSGSLDPRDMFVYLHVKLSGVVITQNENGLSLGMKVTPQVSVENWEQAPNLVFGNLVCISPNGNFKDVIWATVMNRSLLKSHEIVLLDLCTECNTMSDSEAVRMIEASGGQTLIAESPTYYKAYQPVLKALQQIEPNKLSFQQELVGVKNSPQPSYITTDSTITKSIITTHLDDSQQKAVKQALMNRLAIIQGPPGTGKTFVGIKLIQLLNSVKPPIKLPILVLTYKNHVLDEFLMDLLKLYPDGVVRVGGRSQEPGLQGCNLNQLNKDKLTGMAQSMHSDVQKYKAKIEDLKPKVEKAFKKLEKDKTLTLQCLRKHLNSEQIQQLLKGCNWAEANIPSVDNIVKKKKKHKMSAGIMYKEEALEILEMLNGNAEEFLSQNSEDEIWTHVNLMVVTAIKQWIPPKCEFDDLEQDLYSHVKLSSNINKEVRLTTHAHEKDSLVIEEERLTAYATDFDSKEDILKNMIMLDSKKGSKEWMPTLISNAKSILEDIPPGYLSTREDLWQLGYKERVLLIQAILHNIFDDNGKNLEDQLREYQRLCRAKNEIENKHKVDILKSKTVVGMTITGASIYHDFLAQLRPQIIVVEEAAEVLEPQLVAAIGDWCEQLIMIGDHKQLRPSVDSITLVDDYKFDVSMMERLINNDLAYATLTKQNRMRPEFANMLLDIYPKLESNFIRVIKNTPPACIGFPMYFWHHSNVETKHHHTYTNEEEADRAIQLALFLIQQGYEPNKITILASYLRQVRLLRVKMIKAQKKHPEIMDLHKKDHTKEKEEDSRKPNKVQIQTIDNYQGDENEIVIVSLVRSNNRNSIGFLKAENRRCVAQSRARCGMYFIGNKDTIYSSTWGHIVDHMTERDLIGESITLQCPRHDIYSKVQVKSSSDITLGCFCDMPCGKLMDCKKHLCKRKCQPNHRHLQCTEIMSFVFSQCGHHGKRKCSQEESDVLCKLIVKHHFKTCPHSTERYCYQKEDEIHCQEVCGKPLPCYHKCEALCSQPCSVDTCKICRTLREIEEKKRRKKEEEERAKIIEETSKELEKMKKQPISDQVIRYELKPSGDTASEFYDIEDMVKKYVKVDHKWFPIVKKIEKVSNGKLKMRWLKKKGSMFDPSYTPLKFHGTNAKAVESILKDGFIMPVPKNQMYGPGIYFATDSSKSAQELYTQGSNMLMLCRVLLGKTYTVNTARTDMRAKKLNDLGFDSLYAKRDTKKSGGVLFDEYVVYHPHAALPEYVIHYERSNDIQMSETLQKLEIQTIQKSPYYEYSIQPRRGIKMNDPLDVHFRIAEAQFLRLLNTNTGKHSFEAKNVPTNVKEVIYCINRPLLLKFEKMQQQFKAKYTGKEGDYILAFHGTEKNNIQHILKNNFDLSMLAKGSGDKGWYGAGIYFSEFPKVGLYYGESLLLCRVLPGKSYDMGVKNTMVGTNLKPGYDSHRVNKDGSGRGEEIVIFNADQILPCYVIKL